MMGFNEIIPDVLLPHLNATMGIDWSSLSAENVLRLEKVDSNYLKEKPLYTKISSHIKKRCGDEAFFIIESLAKSGGQVSFNNMQMVQQYILGISEAPFRKRTAYTKVRRERYAYFNGVEDIFRIKIEKDDSDECHPLIKAVRLYLDILFFHPFEDGNSRAAMLWFVFYCMKFCYPLPDFSKIIGFGFVPGNKACYLMFCQLAIAEVLGNE